MGFVKGHYKTIAFGLLLLLILFKLITQTSIGTENYNIDNVLNTITELSSEKYDGRRYGTEGNYNAVKYIEEQFKSIGLKPGGNNGTFLRNYSEYVKVYNGTPGLEVIDNRGKVIKTYEYNKDFTEDGSGYDIAGEILSGFNVFAEGYYPSASAEKEIAVGAMNQETDEVRQQLFMWLNKSGYKGYISIVEEDEEFKPISIGTVDRNKGKTGYEIPVLYIRESVSKELLGYSEEGFKLRMKTVIDCSSSRVSDIIGVIKGTGNEYLLITAHLDHIGKDLDGNVYPGALDNASGIGTMLELARYINSQNIKPTKTIVFIALNAKEGGSLGALQYARVPSFRLDRSTVLNFDMIGGSEGLPLNIVYYDFYDHRRNRMVDPASKLRYQMSVLSKNRNINSMTVNSTDGDHAYFDRWGVPAVTISDNDRLNTYTKEDTIVHINKKSIDRALKLSMNYINQTAYSNAFTLKNELVRDDLINFFKLEFPLLAILLILTLQYYHDFKNKYTDFTLVKLRYPKSTIKYVLLLCIVISYFPSIYPYAPVPGQNVISLIIKALFNIGRAFVLWPMYFLYLVPGALVLFLTKYRIGRWEYKGNGEEYNIMYYVALFTTIITSTIASYIFYGKDKYYFATPDFAKDFGGKLVIHCIIGLIAFLIFSFAQGECGRKTKNYVSYAIFGLIFCIMLSSFYVPITLNKYVIEQNLIEVYGGQEINVVN